MIVFELRELGLQCSGDKVLKKENASEIEMTKLFLVTWHKGKYSIFLNNADSAETCDLLNCGEEKE